MLGSYENNSGKEVTLEYQSSRYLNLEDKRVGKSGALFTIPINKMIEIVRMVKKFKLTFLGSVSLHWDTTWQDKIFYVPCPLNI